jgi:hypothetical protein
MIGGWPAIRDGSVDNTYIRNSPLSEIDRVFGVFVRAGPLQGLLSAEKAQQESSASSAVSEDSFSTSSHVSLVNSSVNQSGPLSFDTFESLFQWLSAKSINIRECSRDNC